MFGFFVLKSLDGKDAQGASFLAKVESQMTPGIRGTLFLPPYLRPNQCNIAAGSVVWGCLDEVTGRGFAMFGKDGADFQYFFDADIQVKKTLTVNGDIQSSSGDVKAGSISLKTHTHPITAAQFTGTIDPTTGSATGEISGNTQAPQ